MKRVGLFSLLVALIVCFAASSFDPCLAKKSPPKARETQHHDYQETDAPPAATEEPAGQTSQEAEPSSDQASNSSDDSRVRVNNLANLEALLNIIVNGCEILGLVMAPPFFLAGLVLLCIKGKRIWGFVSWGAGIFLVVGALALPGIINWLVASARDANLFS